MNFEVNNAFNPSLWFVCGFCRQAFPSVDTLKNHKVKEHLENSRNVRCIVFEEKLYDEDWSPTENSIPSKANLDADGKSDSEIKPSNVRCKCICHFHNDKSSVCVQTEREILCVEQDHLSDLPNPFILVSRISSELEKSIRKKSIGSRKRKRSVPNRYERKTTHVPKKRNAKRSHQEKIENSDVDDDVDTFPEPVSPSSSVPYSEEPPEPLELCTPIIAENLESSLPLIEWLILQKQKELQNQNPNSDDSSKNVILLDPDPTMISDEPFEINVEHPVTCRLCHTKLDTEDGLRNHVENCWFHNKPRHLYCVSCEESFNIRETLNRHIRSKHGEEKYGDNSDEGHDLNLPLAEWLKQETEKRKNVVVLEPDLQVLLEFKSVTKTCPVKCKLCHEQLTSDTMLKKHVKICWRKNKYKHLYCVYCKKTYDNNALLKTHTRRSHRELEFREAQLSNDEDSEDDNENDNDKGSELDAAELELPILQWLQKEKENPKNQIALEPNLTLFINFEGVTPQTPVKCVLCQQMLTSDTLLKNHVKTCWRLNKARHIYCVVCRRTLPDHKALIKHQIKALEHSINLQTYLKCTVCEVEFETKAEIDYHKQSLKNFLANMKLKKTLSQGEKVPPKVASEGDTSTPAAPATADRNEKNTEAALFNWLEYQRQYRFSDGTENIILIDPQPRSGQTGEINRDNFFTCRLCSKKLMSVASVKMHVNNCYHQNREKHRFCVPCEKAYGSPKELQEHKKIQHPEELRAAFRCRVCNKEFLDENEFFTHEKTHRDPTFKHFLCPSCPLRFTTKLNLDRHQVVHGKVTDFLCKFCGKSFNSKMFLGIHERSHTGERPYVCQFENCNLTFISKFALQNHKHIKHVKELGLEPHLCPTCGLTFGAQNLLNRHIKICGVHESFSCPHVGCTKTFRANSQLVEHIRVHTGETPYQCEECGLAFAMSSTFKKHQRTHGGTFSPVSTTTTTSETSFQEMSPWGHYWS